MIDSRRIRHIKKGKKIPGPVVYWMGRDQRAHDNWALLYAMQIAREQHTTLIVAFCMVPTFLEATLRQYDFMLQGLEEVAGGLRRKNIPFVLLLGDPAKELPIFLETHEAMHLVCDFSPLRISREWKTAVASSVDCSMTEVDAHNIIPCWIASPKKEYAARTFRPKVHTVLHEFLTDFPLLQKQDEDALKGFFEIDWKKARTSLSINENIVPVNWIIPGEKAAKRALKEFIMDRLSRYPDERNNPLSDAQSDLSPYLHFGQLSAQRIAWEVSHSPASDDAKDVFLEELIVRKELADNFCFYESQYDSSVCFPDWAKKTLANHADDHREFIYTTKQFEEARTHDELWNAAQMEMVKKGKMHGYVRMYWAKKILEWSKSPADAMKIALYLNDTYELDGRDPNGYVGVAWSMGGVHDRPWFDREIFGTVRYMSFDGMKRKFDVQGYITYVENL